MEDVVRKVDEVAGGDGGEMEVIARGHGLLFGDGEAVRRKERHQTDETAKDEAENNITENKTITIKKKS